MTVPYFTTQKRIIKNEIEIKCNIIYYLKMSTD